jgi:hypothetical protein
MTHDELEALAEEEAFDVWQDGISDFTPASKELERRRLKADKKWRAEREAEEAEKRRRRDEAEKQRIEEIDFSEFDY